jgi:hypothetical protein
MAFHQKGDRQMAADRRSVTDPGSVDTKFERGQIDSSGLDLLDAG